MSGFYNAAKERYMGFMLSHLNVQVKGKANPDTSVNGNMFSFLDKSGRLCLRLSKVDQADFIAEFDTDPVQQYGAIMKEYVELPLKVFDDDALVKSYLDKCHSYAKSLPFKPTKR